MDRAGTAFHLDIYDKNSTSGEAVNLTGSSQPFTTNEEDDNDIYMPIRTQSGYIRFVVKTESDRAILSAMMPSHATDRPVVLYDADGDVQWVGFLSPEYYSQPWTSLPYEVEVPVISVMSAMQSTDFTQSDGFVSLSSVMDTVKGYLPSGVLSVASPDSLDFTIRVPNINFQTLLSKTEREDAATANIYSTQAISDVVEYFCKYYGLSCREHMGTIYFYAHDCQAYAGGTVTPSALAMSDFVVRSDSNKTGFAPAYGVIRGEFDVGNDKATNDLLGLPSNYASGLGVKQSKDNWVQYYDNDNLQAYVDGARSTDLELSTNLTNLSVKSFGQFCALGSYNLSDYGDTDPHPAGGYRTWETKPTAGYTISWTDGLFFRSKYGAQQCTAMKLLPDTPAYVLPNSGALFHINFDVTNDMPNDNKLPNGYTPFIRSIFAKVKFGDYYLASTIHTKTSKSFADTYTASYSWQKEECICEIVLYNNKPLFSLYGENVANKVFFNPISLGFSKMDGVNVQLPDDLVGTSAKLSIEFVANAYPQQAYWFRVNTKENEGFGGRTDVSTNDWISSDKKTYNFLQYYITGLEVSVLYAADTASRLSTDNDQNKYIIPLNNGLTRQYEVSSVMTTRRGIQFGTGLLLTKDNAYCSTYNEVDGLNRRAKLLGKPRTTITVIVDHAPRPVDTISWRGYKFAVLSISEDWKNKDVQLKLLNLD